MALTRALRSCQGFKPNSSATRCRNRYKRRLTSSGRATRTKEHSRVRLLRTFSTVRANSADNSNCARGFGSAVVTAIREAAPLARFFTCYLSMRGPPPPEVTESAGSALITFHPRPQRPVSPQPHRARTASARMPQNASVEGAQLCVPSPDATGRAGDQQKTRQFCGIRTEP